MSWPITNPYELLMLGAVGMLCLSLAASIIVAMGMGYCARRDAVPGEHDEWVRRHRN